MTLFSVLLNKVRLQVEKINNITACDQCGAPLIYEEHGSHRCFTGRIVESLAVDKNTIFVFDGKQWYRVPTKLQQPKRTPDEGNTTKILVITSFLVTF